MSAVVGVIQPNRDGRAQRYTTKRYEAFRLDGPRTFSVTGRAPGIKVARSVDEALNAAKLCCFHKDRLLIRETDDGEVTLHIYAIRKSKAKYVAGDFGLPTRVEDLHAELICSIDAGVLK